MDIKDILSVLEADMAASGVAALDLALGDFAVSLRLPPAAPSPAVAAAPVRPLKAPYAGYFTPGAGETKVRAGQVVGTITVGLIRLAVATPVAGRLSAPAVEAGVRVDFGDVLFTLE